MKRTARIAPIFLLLRVIQNPSGFMEMSEGTFLKNIFFSNIFRFFDFFSPSKCFPTELSSETCEQKLECFSTSCRGWFSGAGGYPDRVGASKTPEMNATGPYLSNKTIFKQKYCLGKKWEQFQCGDTDPEFVFFSRKLRLEGGGVSCFSRDFEIYCLNCPKSAKIGLGGPGSSRTGTAPIFFLDNIFA